MKDYVAPDSLAQLRAKYGLSQRDFADVVGLANGTIARYESGAKPLTRKRYERFVEDTEKWWATYDALMANVMKVVIDKPHLRRMRMASVIYEDADEEE